MLKFGRPRNIAPTQSQPQAQAEPQPQQQAQPNAEPQVQECDWWTAELDQQFTQALGQAGVAPSQIDGLKGLFVDAVCQAEADEASEAQAAKQQTLRDLESQWGRDADRMFAAANQAASALGLEAEALETLLSSPNAVQIVSSFAKLGEAMAEDGALPLAENQAGMAKANAASDLARLQADKDHVAAYLNRDHPGHQAAKRQRKTLIDMTLNR